MNEWNAQNVQNTHDTQHDEDMRKHSQHQAKLEDVHKCGEALLRDTPNAALDVAMRVNAFHRANFEAFSQAMTLSAQTMMAAQEEILTFFAGRMNKDMEMAQNLLSGNIFGEILNRQSEYVRGIMHDYSGGSQQLMERGLQLVKENARPMEKRADEVTEDVQSEAPRVAAE